MTKICLTIVLFFSLIFPSLYAGDIPLTWQYQLSDANLEIQELKDEAWQEVGDKKLIGGYAYNGFVYYRAFFESDTQKTLGLYLDRVKDVDEAYLNGRLVGKTGSFSPEFQPKLDIFRLYSLPSDLLSSGLNELILKVYVGYGFRQGIEARSVRLGQYHEVSIHWYLKQIQWSGGRIALAFICLLLSFAALPWFRKREHALRAASILFLGFSSFLFAIGYSRFQFHFLSVLDGYRFHALSSIGVTTGIFIYACLLPTVNLKRLAASIFVIGFAMGVWIVLQDNLIDARFLNRQWLLFSIVLPLSVPLLLCLFDAHKRYFAYMLGCSLACFILVHDLLNTFSIIHTTRLSTYGTGLILLSAFLQEVLIAKREIQKAEREQAQISAIANTTSMIAHDLRAPFSSMKMFLKLTEREKSISGDLKSLGFSIKKSLDSVQLMLTELLNYSKEPQITGESCNLKQVVEACISEAKSRFESTPPKLEMNSQDLDTSVQMSSEHLMRVIGNILNNAYQATAESKDPLVRLTVSRQAGGLGLAIFNSGAHIAEEDLEQLTQLFFSKKSQQGGTGLGLASAKRILDAYNAKMVFKNSNSPTGVEVLLILPT